MLGLFQKAEHLSGEEVVSNLGAPRTLSLKVGGKNKQCLQAHQFLRLLHRQPLQEQVVQLELGAREAAVLLPE